MLHRALDVDKFFGNSYEPNVCVCMWGGGGCYDGCRHLDYTASNGRISEERILRDMEGTVAA
jgi:hypothetical protein